jgi:hypothetical protein
MKKSRRFHLDKRAASLAATSDDGDDSLLTTAQAADWLGVSTQFLEIARHKGDGPEFVRLSPKCIRYRPAALRQFAIDRSHTHTKEYQNDEN